MRKQPATQTAADHLVATTDRDTVFSLLVSSGERIGKSPLTVVRQWLPLVRGSGKLTLQDYFRFRLYDDELHDADSRKKFVSDSIYWKVAHKTLDLTWKATVEDKAVMYGLLQSYGLKTPTTVAVIDKAEREYGKPRVLRNLDAFISFLGEPGCLPLFLKPVCGSGSSGAMIAEEIRGDQVVLTNREPVSIEHLFDRMIGSDSYLVQSIMPNHPRIQEIVSPLCTIRLYNFFEEDGLSSHYPMMKIPAGGNVADNFWRTGNLLAAVDSDTGQIRRVIQGTGFNQKEVTHHPDSQLELTGFEIPYWAEVRELNEQCARLFAPIGFITTDLAVSPDGPVVVEVNYGGSFALPQILYNTGFLTDQRRAFFRKRGWKF